MEKASVLFVVVSLLSACGHQQYHAPENMPLSKLHIQTASKEIHSHDVLLTEHKVCADDETYSLGSLSRDEAINISIPSQKKFEFVINSYANLKLTKDSSNQEISCTASIAFTPHENTHYYARHWVSQDAKNCTIRLFDRKGKVLPSKEIAVKNMANNKKNMNCLTAK
jgi:hypothetical protein